MNSAHAAQNFLWALIFGGLAGFFVVAGGRFVTRGYRIFSSVLACATASAAFGGLASLSGPGAVALLASRASLTFGLLAGALNCHFLLVYCGFGSRVLAWIAYVLALGGGLAAAGMTAFQWGQVETLRYPEGYASPAGTFTIFVLLVVAFDHFASAWVLAFAARRRVRGAWAMLVMVTILAPATLLDVFATLDHGNKWFLAEAGMWLYVLVVLGSLLSEVEGTKGLLRKTTSSLAERTAELESSYAEIDLMQTELTRKQQLAAVGELAASIAHEVRNPLAIIMNAVSGLRRTTISAKDQETLLSIVNEEAERLNHLVTELLRFARPVNAARGPASLFDICQQATQDPPDGFQVLVSMHDGEKLGPVWVDPGLFRLALDNLIANATQAMPHGGEIELSVRRGTFADGTAAAVVDVRDTGCGMKEVDLERARKPFFTTKPRGTGLGIPIVDRIVEAHGGEMEFSSTQGQGTVVSLKLPIEAEAEVEPSYPGAKHPSTRRRMRSLVPGKLDDDGGLVRADSEMAEEKS